MPRTLPVSFSPTAGAAAEGKGFVGTGTDLAEEIQHRAYSMWVCAGRPAHADVAHWLAAETEVLGEVKQGARSRT